MGIGVSHQPLIDMKEAGRYRSHWRRWSLTSTASTPRHRRWCPRPGPRRPWAEDARAGSRPHRRGPPIPRDARAHGEAREAVGAAALVAPEQAIVVETDPVAARELARVHLSGYLGLPNYANNWRRLGFTEDDIAGGGSDRLVDALVAWGDVDTIARRVQEHRDAGADHVCVQVIVSDRLALPRDEWRAVAPALGEDEAVRSAPVTDAPAPPGTPSTGSSATTSSSPGSTRSPPPTPTWSRSRRTAVATRGATSARDRHRRRHRRADTKPAHWVDASIHAVELTATVAACTSCVTSSTATRRATRRDRGAAHAHVLRRAPRQPGRRRVGAGRLAPCRRRSMRPWPWPDAHRWPGLTSRTSTATAASSDAHRRPGRRVASTPTTTACWCRSPPDGGTPGEPRYRLLGEGTVDDYDGFTVPTPRPPEGLDLNRNFPAGWGTGVLGTGDHPLSEPEIDALVRAIVARPTSAGTTRSTPAVA